MKRRSFLGLLSLALPVTRAGAAPAKSCLNGLHDAGDAAALPDFVRSLDAGRALKHYESLNHYPPECYFADAATRIYREIVTDVDGSRYPSITFERQQDFDDWEARRMDEFGFPLKGGRG